MSGSCMAAVGSTLGALGTCAQIGESVASLMGPRKQYSDDEKEIAKRPDLYELLEKEVGRLVKAKEGIVIQQGGRPVTDPDEAAAKSALERTVEEAESPLRRAQSLLQQNVNKRVKLDAASLVYKLRKHNDLINTHWSASVRAECRHHDPNGPKAQCALLCDPKALYNFSPTWFNQCEVYRKPWKSFGDGRDRTIEGFNDSELPRFDAVVIAVSGTRAPVWVAEHAMHCGRVRRKPLLWVLLGDTDEIIPPPLAAGSLMLAAKPDQRPQVEWLLYQLSCEVSRASTAPLNALPLNHGLRVVANALRHGISFYSSPVDFVCTRAEGLYRGSCSDTGMLRLSETGFRLQVQARMLHGSTGSKQPATLDYEQAAELTLRNLAGKIDKANFPQIHWHGFGCTELSMPFDAYLQLQEYIAQKPDAMWVLPCEEKGDIVWKETPLYRAELCGPFLAQISVPAGHPAADVQWLAGWLADVGVGKETVFPSPISESPEALPEKGSAEKGSAETLATTDPGSLAMDVRSLSSRASSAANEAPVTYSQV